MVRIKTDPEVTEIKIVNRVHEDELKEAFETLCLKDDDEKVDKNNDNEKFIERAPMRNKDLKKFVLDKPYASLNAYQDHPDNKFTSVYHKCGGSVKCCEHNNAQLQTNLTFTDEEILRVANSQAFIKFVEANVKTVMPRRESNDSSYFSDSPSPDSPETDTYQIIKDPEKCEVEKDVAKHKKEVISTCQRPAREKLKNGIDQKQKMKKWVDVNMLDDEELFDVDADGKSLLHKLLLKDEEPYIKESFYTLVEVMLQRSEKRFDQLTRKEPKIQDILRERHKELLDYFEEVVEHVG